MKFTVNNQLKYFACSNMQFIRSEKDVFNRCNITHRNTSETKTMQITRYTHCHSNNKHMKCAKMKAITFKLNILNNRFVLFVFMKAETVFLLKACILYIYVKMILYIYVKTSTSAAHMGGRLGPPVHIRPFWPHLCIWSNPKPATNVRQAYRP